MSKPTEQTAWDSFYGAGQGVMRWPSECVVRFVARYKARHAAGGATTTKPRGLDLGCGAGRHLWLLAREGFDHAGVDISPVAVEMSNKTLAAEGFAKTARVFDGHTLPFDDGSFDLAVSYGVLDSMEPAAAQRLADETLRLLRPDGQFMLTLRASADQDFMRIGPQIARNTVRVTADLERDTVQHFFDYEEVRGLMAGFRELIVHREDRIDWSGTGRSYGRWTVIGGK